MEGLKHTPGPWMWSVNESSKYVSLKGRKNGCTHLVMDFKRYGMQSGQPRFEEDGTMRDSTEYFTEIKGQEHNSSWNKTISGNANARLIAAAPEILEALISSAKRDAIRIGGINPFTVDAIETATGMSISEVLKATARQDAER